MLPRVTLGRHLSAPSANIDNYRTLVGDDLVDDIITLAEELAGLRVCNVNSSPFGGGVAELLSREIPLLQALKIQVEWKVLHGDQQFFSITKDFHNALQGAEYFLDGSVKKKYVEYNRRSAELMEEGYDIYMVHDPQPAALPRFCKRSRGKWIWRCHIDSSEPNDEVWQFLKSFIEDYDAAVFTLGKFLPPDLKMNMVRIIPPAIDPLSVKNMDLPDEVCKRAMADSGVDLRRPLLVQVSRFDPWKDPLGVIQAYRLMKEVKPELQLALIGAMAFDDPEAWRMLAAITEESAKDEDIHIYTNLMGFGNMEVNAFQRGCDLVIQKSIKEGFGLVVAEAFWKAKPIVAGDAGGIPIQFPMGYEDYLVQSVEECAEKSLYLLDHRDVMEKFGRAGRERIRRDFLLPRLVRDELLLYKELL